MMMEKNMQKSLTTIVQDYSGRRSLADEDVQIREHRDSAGRLIAVTLSHRSEKRLRDDPEKYGWIGTEERGFVESGDPDVYEANDGSCHHLADMANWPEDITLEYLVQASDEFGWQEADNAAPPGWQVDDRGRVSLNDKT